MKGHFNLSHRNHKYISPSIGLHTIHMVIYYLSSACDFTSISSLLALLPSVAMKQLLCIFSSFDAGALLMSLYCYEIILLNKTDIKHTSLRGGFIIQRNHLIKSTLEYLELEVTLEVVEVG